MYICKFCGKECKNKNSLAQHERRCKENPNRVESPFVKFNKEGNIVGDHCYLPGLTLLPARLDKIRYVDQNCTISAESNFPQAVPYSPDESFD